MNNQKSLEEILKEATKKEREQQRSIPRNYDPRKLATEEKLNDAN